MKIFSAATFREWDAATIRNEPIASINLMERAASRCADWIISNDFDNRPIHVFCGKGNNGGDGLAIARMLSEKANAVSVYIVNTSAGSTADFETNLQRVQDRLQVQTIEKTDHFPPLLSSDVVIDAIFGTGLNKPPSGVAAHAIENINRSGATVISIDLPSGLFADKNTEENTVVHARYTLTFQGLKLSMLLPETAVHCGEIKVLDIGLNNSFYEQQPSEFILAEEYAVKNMLKPRNRFSHKGHFGHALIAAGSFGKMGAAVLAAKACLRSGCGLLTVYVPRLGYDIMQTSVPEAMCETDEEKELLSNLVSIDNYDAVGCGPGIGTGKQTVSFIKNLLERSTKPIVLDADALNCITSDRSLMKLLPVGSILTPHPKEFDRLTHDHKNGFERLATAVDFARRYKIVLVLKGHHSLVATPGGNFFNNTGNAGMAKGGSGDVLTGIITSLLAQKYSPEQAAILGCWLHGLAGDLAKAELGEASMTATDLIQYLPHAFKQLECNS